MAKDVFDKINDYLAKLPDAIEKGMAAVTMRAVDRYAWEFYQRVLQDAPFQRLRGSIELRPFIRKGRYGFVLKFDGYDENNTPLQMIANVIESGRSEGSGVAESGRRYAYGRIEGIQFMGRHLELLSNINREIANKSAIEKWVIGDNHITLSDGTQLSFADLDKYDNTINSES